MTTTRFLYAAAAFLALGAAAPACAQPDFGAIIKQQRNTRAAADATYVRPVAVNMAPLQVDRALRAAGSDLTRTAVVAGHAKVYADVIDGKYPMADKRSAAAMLGLLGSSNSPLVGDARWMQYISGRLIKAYNGSPGLPVKAAALISLALVAGANYASLGEATLAFLGGVAADDGARFELRRTAVIALASIHKPAAVAKISYLINRLAEADGDGRDEVFEITDKYELEDAGSGARTLQASLMLALEEQLNWEASGQALTALRYYASLSGQSCESRWYGDSSLGIKMPKKAGVNRTTLVMARFMLAQKSRGFRSDISDVRSHIERTGNGYGRTFLKETGSARCLIPVIEDDGFKCGTRRSFDALYYNMAFPGGMLYDTDNPPVMPVNFDNCVAARTQKLMLNLAADILMGAAIEHLGLVAIRYGARYLTSWSIDTAYKVVAAGGRLSAANRYAKFGGSIGEYAELTARLWEGYSTATHVQGIVNTTREAME